MPMVNNDHKHYTPCFILQEEQVCNILTKYYYTENDRKLLSTHRHKLESEGTNTIVTLLSSFDKNDSNFFFKVTQMVAKHGRKKNYCSVCRVDYEDYLQVFIFLCSISRISTIDGSFGQTSSANSSSKLNINSK